MNIAIVTNMNGIGLTRDYELLRDFLDAKGHEITPYQFDEPLADDHTHDLAVFLEIIPRDKLGLAKRRFLFANPEWMKPQVIASAKQHIEKIFVKTHEAKRLLDPLFPGKVFYVGFLTRDQCLVTIERRPWFLHIGGNSVLRGTQAVVDAWKWKNNGKGIDAHLIVISSALKEWPELPLVQYYDKIDEEHLRSLQNQCFFHLYPSGTEGFGHALHESLTVGAMILTTNAPPMNEIKSAYYIPWTSKTTYNLADVYHVSAIDIHKGALDMLQLWNRHHRSLFNSREEVLIANEHFNGAFGEHIDQFEIHPAAVRVPKSTGTLQIAFVGNFEAPESTENMVKWALEEGLGHAVWEIQEQKATMGELETAADTCDVFLWVKTPGWLSIHERDMLGYLEMLAGFGIPSISLHLDKFWGIPEREPQIGVHPFWKTEFVWTADGSRQWDFVDRGVNHHWMRPAASEVYCHPGWPREEYRCDVGFVGARSYHREYPFRTELLDFLEEEYRSEFKHIEGLRGHGLNDFYASCKVIVGDCIFSGTPYYWSDRVPETCGRGGFLLHPFVEGLDVPVATFKPQNLADLKEKIGYYLINHEERNAMRRTMATAVALYNTWTHRMREILEVAHAKVLAK